MIWIWIWGLLATSIPVYLLVQFARGCPVGHDQMLALGLFGYVVVPFCVYSIGAYESGPGYEIWATSFEKLFNHSSEALGIIALLASMYFLGNHLRINIGVQKLDRPIRLGVLKILWFGLCVVWISYLYMARELLFSGYTIGYRPDLMGPLATVNLAALLIFLNLKQWEHSRAMRWAYGGLIIANCIALLSMGGRLYVAASLVAISIQYFNTTAGRRPGTRLRGLLLLAGIVGGLAFLGLWRLEGAVEIKMIGVMVLAEPLLTSITMGALADCQLIDLVSAPYNFISSVVNFIPSALLTNKASLMVELDPSGNCLESPFGATHLATALLVNFGLLGSAIAVMLFAMLMAALRGRKSGWWMYNYLCCLLPFMLFRDGFLIFNKAFFAIGIIFGVALLMTSPRVIRSSSSTPHQRIARPWRRLPQ
jgi:hypothetical protein